MFLFFFSPPRMYNLSISAYYMTEEGEDSPFICSAPRENGMLRCHDVPPTDEGGSTCSMLPSQSLALTGSANSCINWNHYYNVCQPGDHNPHKGAVNFDNIGYAWIAIFQVRSRNMESRLLKMHNVLFCTCILKHWRSAVMECNWVHLLKCCTLSAVLRYLHFTWVGTLEITCCIRAASGTSLNTFVLSVVTILRKMLNIGFEKWSDRLSRLDMLSSYIHLNICGTYFYFWHLSTFSYILTLMSLLFLKYDSLEVFKNEILLLKISILYFVFSCNSSFQQQRQANLRLFIPSFS